MQLSDVEVISFSCINFHSGSVVRILRNLQYGQRAYLYKTLCQVISGAGQLARQMKELLYRPWLFKIDSGILHSQFCRFLSSLSHSAAVTPGCSCHFAMQLTAPENNPCQGKKGSSSLERTSDLTQLARIYESQLPVETAGLSKHKMHHDSNMLLSAMA